MPKHVLALGSSDLPGGGTLAASAPQLVRGVCDTTQLQSSLGIAIDISPLATCHYCDRQLAWRYQGSTETGSLYVVSHTRCIPCGCSRSLLLPSPPPDLSGTFSLTSPFVSCIWPQCCPPATALYPSHCHCSLP